MPIQWHAELSNFVRRSTTARKTRQHRPPCCSTGRRAAFCFALSLPCVIEVGSSYTARPHRFFVSLSLSLSVYPSERLTNADRILCPFPRPPKHTHRVPFYRAGSHNTPAQQNAYSEPKPTKPEGKRVMEFSFFLFFLLPHRTASVPVLRLPGGFRAGDEETSKMVSENVSKRLLWLCGTRVL